MQAKDVMTTDVVTVDPESDVMKVAKILLDHRVSAAPALLMGFSSFLSL
jgi:CBS domain-containing protein